MKIIKTLSLLAILFATGMANAQTQKVDYDTEAEMQEQMRMIVNTLGLQTTEIVQLGGIMDKKRQEKNALIEQINALKAQMTAVEIQAETEIEGMLTQSEWERYIKEIKPGIDQALKEKMDKVK